jgi:hypothetical protein
MFEVPTLLIRSKTAWVTTNAFYFLISFNLIVIGCVFFHFNFSLCPQI